ncbi:hypothetical protein TNCV_4202651 [Trichonephila clavipes]|uniref:Uncharacterized protein n=1 Tax=Trichonephila clavipes TaxID=2585209 RepID=A0A8X6VBZ4_TRICX|nr:hypothetical protein TNCV_4202651 [Trichonephila clavipes]
MLYLLYVKIVIFASNAVPYVIMAIQWETWRNLGDRAKLASFLVTKLVTLVSSRPYGFFWKLVGKTTIISRSMTQAVLSQRIREVYKYGDIHRN